MAVGAFNKLANTTIETTEAKYETLIRESEQLRILKDYVRAEKVIMKSEVLTLIDVLEGNK